ncbi:hypothetical protein HPB50_022339 [Hyalomma asiaticum]|uniref:Uncharacterized protein n=1 Tax=Hyalomma asiaticum TaxID=266040 RepID=A0ACB7RWP7_HYAAI|nr:hypothetical protein HPB50_022339 [Hyalomma asiaticum]
MKKVKKGKKLPSASSRQLREEEVTKTDKTNPDIEESAGPTYSSEQDTLGSRDRRAGNRKAKPLPNENAINAAMLQFAVDVYLELRSAVVKADATTLNLLFSPVALQTVMAMMLALSGGHTAEQLAKALHLQGIQDDDFKVAAVNTSPRGEPPS